MAVYWKTESEQFCKAIEKMLRNYNWNPVRIRYGSYDKASYKETLKNSLFAVFISESESQGLALAESWAMDVPTLVWDPQEVVAFGRKFSESSSCPYLNNLLGKRWNTFQELENLLKVISHDIQIFTPRAWVLKNMSDQVSAKMLLSLIKSIS